MTIIINPWLKAALRIEPWYMKPVKFIVFCFIIWPVLSSVIKHEKEAKR